MTLRDQIQMPRPACTYSPKRFTAVCTAAAAAVRVPLMIGSKKEVEYYESFYKN
jgi:hypothetical protein